MNRQKVLKELTIVAILTAACFSATFIQKKMPTGDMVHLGNFVMIISALLLGGIQGGLVGSLGMGLYDLIYYSSKPSTIIRTFVLKFLVGFIVGYLFRLVIKKKIDTKYLLIGSSLFFLLLFGVSLGLFIAGDKSSFDFSSGLIAKVSNFFGSGKTVNISLYIPIFTIIFSLGMGLAVIFEKKMSRRSRAALFSITVAVLANILGEFILRWVLEGTFNVLVSDIKDGFTVSLITATSKIPGSLITGFISVVLAVLIYEPVYRGVRNLDIFKDNTRGFDEEDTEIEEDIIVENHDNKETHSELI